MRSGSAPRSRCAERPAGRRSPCGWPLPVIIPARGRALPACDPVPARFRGHPLAGWGLLHHPRAAARRARSAARLARTGRRTAWESLGGRFRAATPEVTLVLTPQQVHVEGAMAVVTAGTMAGTLEGGATPITLRCPVDRELARAVASAVRDAGVPMVGVSYGANDAAAAVMPMDWGTQVPLHFM